ncbi:prepilin peptidase [Cryobacterium algoricola]|uniref:Prepilin peptidase n=1 Tax=Cryobacterium algoricola TaxID=1259183 RepID=A0ABY2ICK8_9MICO|nr:A24 family peptidase [Cryobacterium algoricola]TFB87094.1 prepilin peptidase [Cryobacterium algoricola]
MTALIFVSAILGVVIGSFLNVVVYRVPNGLSIVSPPSACPRCGAAIRPYDNIPVVSWLVLRGKCRQCKTAISTRYPLVELGTGLAFAAVSVWALATRFPEDVWGASGTDLIVGGLVLAAYLYLAAVSIALALIDLDVHRLPNGIVLPGYAVGALLLGAASVIGGDYSALLGGAIGLVVLWAAYFLMAFFYPGGMGLGDVKLAGVLGLFLGYLGWGELIIGAFAAFLLGGIFGIALLISRRANRKSGIPFGPWMLMGAWVGIFCGEAIWSGYLSLIGVR